jgi:hypothetical protein
MTVGDWHSAHRLGTTGIEKLRSINTLQQVQASQACKKMQPELPTCLAFNPNANLFRSSKSLPEGNDWSIEF